MKNILSIQSHVVFGHAGNSAAVFPMRRMGVNVWPLNTVQFSNHTQYPQWRGCVMPPDHLAEIVQGIGEIDKLKSCDAVLSGYIGSAEQGNYILDIIKKIKQTNPEAWYFCDPVMGHPEKGCIVVPGVAEFFCEKALPVSDIIAPNLLELETLSARKIENVEQTISAARELCEKGPKVVLVKHLSRAGYRTDCFEMLLVTKKHSWHISRPLIDTGERQPVGVGDLTSGLLLVNLLKNTSLTDEDLKTALEHVASAVYEVMLETQVRGEYELQIIAAQDKMVTPTHLFSATLLD
ncbi:pyridoxal kinase PdxY [Xenorhabdus nematophila]|uniref:Pyridoxal kinase PdxY n=1 Tax=Xenorhabdus nematophila (strain ATCC 19061 / DSM 3370 / CCUG 14189 / LMG 1036 / NCIMB 9965 / AN6) TaxID=406817 RepID=D3VD83_XENNA|nr:pyridoxal kinase PdxY [Xenorhabdus nematophila]CBJ89949.1 pyridoxal kinase 2/pyridoxine kinase [Xenorhabdus nematophila ATCC 19061]CEE93163.1 pyridoxal kinase 2/pyridoxine kinase [Xenorhabdus nematophila str. Anatoliense]CEE95906.1 pyridoxal kinase 2/pyridoxine kinase [Xenorhabdus nematophila str. Anatoliense]CEK22826.1 pyridoxal kinase 2/pyridoxine kinase [Xenorhabdus nematophila AN6/1]